MRVGRAEGVREGMGDAVEESAGEFVSAKGVRLATRQVVPAADGGAPVCAVYVFLHGLGDWSGRYVHVLRALAARGVACHAVDHEGHGKSEGVRAYVGKWEGLVDDCEAFAASVVGQYRGEGDGGAAPPCYVHGQSMGGLAALYVAARDPDRWSGVVLTSPALGVEMNCILRVQSLFSPCLSACFPQARIVDAVRPQDMCRDEAGWKAYRDDPLNTCGPTCVRTAVEIKRAFDGLWGPEGVCGRFSLPLLILHGTVDKCTLLSMSERFVDECATPPDAKRLVRLTHLYHTLFHEPEKDAVIRTLVAWVCDGGAASLGIHTVHDLDLTAVPAETPP